MKAPSASPVRPARSARSPRRLVVAVVAAGTAAALLGGCGFGTRQQAAAVVNGETISQDQVQETYDQLQAAKYQFTENVVLTALVAAPLLQKAVSPQGGFKPDATYAQVIATIPDASQSTKDFVAAVALIQAQTMTPAQVQTYRTDLGKADITVNPRFGKVVPSPEGPIYFSIGPDTPNWIAPGAGPTAPATAPATAP
ncbi:MAG: hypothetical protein ABI336_03000 [Humibacillus sp.]